MTFEKALGISGDGQGKEPKIKTDRRLRRDREIAVAIAIDKETSVEKSVATVSNAYGVGEKTGWRSWGAQGDKAGEIVEQFADATSRSDDHDP